MINCVFFEFFYCFKILVLYLIEFLFIGCNIYVRYFYFEIIWINVKFFSLIGSDRWRTLTNVRRLNVRRRRILILFFFFWYFIMDKYFFFFLVFCNRRILLFGEERKWSWCLLMFDVWLLNICWCFLMIVFC